MRPAVPIAGRTQSGMLGLPGGCLEPYQRNARSARPETDGAARTRLPENVEMGLLFVARIA
jgi:hypothetical protein